MSKLSRVLVAMAGLVLALLYFTPLWRIDLGAPQYPEGLGMRIWVHQIQGATPNDLQNVRPNLPKREMMGTSHWPHLDKPKEFDAVLDEFLAKVK